VIYRCKYIKGTYLYNFFILQALILFYRNKCLFKIHSKELLHNSKLNSYPIEIPVYTLVNGNIQILNSDSYNLQYTIIISYYYNMNALLKPMNQRRNQEFVIGAITNKLLSLFNLIDTF